MSVSFTKYLGYCIDIHQEYEALKENNEDVEELLETQENIPQVLSQLGFVGYYGYNKPNKNDITLLDDGMGGEYTYLMYIIDVNYDAYYYDEDDNIDKSINEILANIPVPETVANSLKKVYQEIFQKDTTKNIQLQTFIHAS